MRAQPTALELMADIEAKGYALTLDARTTAQKWVTGRNLFMGITGPGGVSVRNAYGPIAIELPLRAGHALDWTAADGGYVASYSEALRDTVKRGAIRRSSTFYQAMRVLAQLAK